MSPVEEIGAVGEDDVIVLAEAFFSERWRGDEENGAGAEAEEEGRAVPPGDLGEAPVEWPLEEVDVADQREGRERAWGQVSEFVEDMEGCGIQGHKDYGG